MNSAGGVRITTPHGEVVAGRLPCLPSTAARQLTLCRQALLLRPMPLLTEPLTPRQRARLGTLPPGLTPGQRHRRRHLSLHPDHRILIRQHVAHAPTLQSRRTNEAMVRRHRQLLLSRFSRAGELAFAHSWSGLISVSRNGRCCGASLAQISTPPLGCNSAGISKQTMAGKVLADLVRGGEPLGRADARPGHGKLSPRHGPCWIQGVQVISGKKAATGGGRIPQRLATIKACYRGACAWLTGPRPRDVFTQGVTGICRLKGPGLLALRCSETRISRRCRAMKQNSSRPMMILVHQELRVPSKLM